MTITTWVVTSHGYLAEISRIDIGKIMVDIAGIRSMDMAVKIVRSGAVTVITITCCYS
jgi:hypothetical protein